MLSFCWKVAYYLSIVSIFGLLPQQCSALQLGPVVNADDGSDNIYPNSFIKFTWQKESGDPFGFDVSLVWKNGSLTGLKANVDLNWGSLTQALPDVPPDPYNIAVYQAGKPIVPRGPAFTVLAQPSSSTSGAASTVYVYTTDGQVRTTTVAASVTPSATTTATPASGGKKAPVGAIVGGVVGGVAFLAIIGIILFLLRCRRRSTATTEPIVSPFSPTIGGPQTRHAPSASQASLTHATIQDSATTASSKVPSGLARENDELRDRIRALEAQQHALENRLLINGVMAPDYDETVTSPHPTQDSPLTPDLRR